MNLRQIVEAGGIAAVVNEENLHTVADILMCKTEVEVDNRQLAFDF